jgi:osmotically-inducible protein OsmY
MRFLPSFPILLSGLGLLLVTSCGDAPNLPEASSSTVPAPAIQTAEEVRSDAQAQRRAADRDYEDKIIAISLRERAGKEAARQQNALIDRDFDKATQPMEGEIDGVMDSVKRDKAIVDVDAAQKRKATGAQDAVITADQVRLKADIELKGNEKATAINDRIDHIKAVALGKHQEIAQHLSLALKDSKLEMIADELVVRRRKIDIDYQETLAQATLSHKTAEHLDELRKGQLRTLDNDLKISQTLRDEVIVDPTLAVSSKDVVIATADGVVVISGSVSTEADHQKIIATAKGIAGVVQVTDRIAVQ